MIVDNVRLPCTLTPQPWQVTRVILEKLDASTDGPRSYAYDDATAFHLLAEVSALRVYRVTSLMRNCPLP